jgi:hypothetical protein
MKKDETGKQAEALRGLNKGKIVLNDGACQKAEYGGQDVKKYRPYWLLIPFSIGFLIKLFLF